MPWWRSRRLKQKGVKSASEARQTPKKYSFGENLNKEEEEERDLFWFRFLFFLSPIFSSFFFFLTRKQANLPE